MRDWLDTASKLIGVIGGLITLVSMVFGLTSSLQADPGTLTYILLGIGIAGGLVGLAAFLVYLVRHGRATWVSKRWAALLPVSLVILLASSGGLAFNVYQQVQPPSEVIILVADFDGPDPQRYRVTETMLVRLRDALKQDEDVRVEALGRAITQQEGSAIARAEGEKIKAAIVIWGWYGVAESAAPLSLGFELLRKPRGLPELDPGTKGQVRVVDPAELESFVLQTRLSTEMTVETLVALGLISYSERDWDTAIARFSSVLEESTESAPALGLHTIYYYRAGAYLRKGNLDHAFEDLEAALGMKPDFALGYNGRGIYYGNQGDHERAIQEFNKAIELDPTLARAYANRGMYYGNLGEHEMALQEFDKAIEADPELAFAYAYRGISQANLGDNEKAIIDLDRAIHLDPGDPYLYVNRGYFVSSFLGQRDKALSDLDRAIRLDPKDPVLYINRGLTRGGFGDLGGAIEDYSEAISRAPEHSFAYANRGITYANLGKYEKALQDFDMALSINPEDFAAYTGRGIYYALQGQHDKAIQEYDEAIRIFPTYAYAFLNRGISYREMGEHEEAIEDFDEAISIFPQLPFAYVERAKVYTALEEDAEARKDVDRAVELGMDRDLVEDEIRRVNGLSPWEITLEVLKEIF